MNFSQKVTEASSSVLFDADLLDRDVRTVNGTPLNTLVSTIYSINDDLKGDANTMVSDKTRIAHKNIVKIGTDVITRNVEVMRNEVNPLRVSILEAIEKSHNEDESDSIPYRIEQVKIPSVFKDEAFIDSLSIYKGAAVLTKEERASWIENARYQLRDEVADIETYNMLTAYGYGATSELVREAIPNDFYEDAPFTSIFDAHVGPLIATSLLRDFVVIQNLITTNPAFNNSKALKVRNSLGRALAVEAEKINQADRKKFLFVNPSFINKDRPVNELNVNVFAKAYNKWLDTEGNSIEAFLGHIIQGKGFFRGNFLNAEDFGGTLDLQVKAYQNYLTRNETNNLLRRVKNDRLTIDRALRTYITEGDFEAPGDMVKTFRKYMAENQYTAENNLNYYVRDLVCNVFFPNTYALKLASNVDFYVANSGSDEADVDVIKAKAVPFAICKVVGEWLADQIEC